MIGLNTSTGLSHLETFTVLMIGYVTVTNMYAHVWLRTVLSIINIFQQDVQFRTLHTFNWYRVFK